MEVIIIKDRPRPNRGNLQSFYDLPEDKQTIFKQIKKCIDREHNKDVYVELYGSYYKGYWDELSDYDVTTTQRGIDCFILSKKISLELNLKINIFYLVNRINTISIPGEFI